MLAQATWLQTHPLKAQQLPQYHRGARRTADNRSSNTRTVHPFRMEAAAAAVALGTTGVLHSSKTAVGAAPFNIGV
jgi:hypothetical protein